MHSVCPEHFVGLGDEYSIRFIRVTASVAILTCMYRSFSLAKFPTSVFLPAQIYQVATLLVSNP